MRKPRLIYLCNAIDEQLRSERKITTDSPAATEKVFQVSSALRYAGVGVVILSLGRGRQQKTGKWFSTKLVRINGIPTVYAPFFDAPIVTHLISLIGLLPLVWSLRSRHGTPVILAYNRLPHYLFAMEFAKILRFKRFLDLEDGDVTGDVGLLQRWIARILSSKFNHLCISGGMLASSLLSNQYTGTRTVCCYGVAPTQKYQRDWNAKPLVVLLGGTLQRATGAQLFIDTINELRIQHNHKLSEIEFIVTGTGEMAADLLKLAAEKGFPRVNYLGRVSRKDYVAIIQQAHIGLALKLPADKLADTTFPSKVIELASAGLLIISTSISDVPKIFETDGALYLRTGHFQELVAHLIWALDNRSDAACIAGKGQARVQDTCSREKVGNLLKAFFYP